VTHGEFWALPVLSAHFPLVFENGARWVEFHGHCGDCDVQLPDHAFRGHVTRPFGQTFLVEAWGVCPTCDVLTTFHWRLLPDLTMVGRNARGDWGVWQPRRSLWSRLRKFLNELFSGPEGDRR
jgi:hypothetical protein